MRVGRTRLVSSGEKRTSGHIGAVILVVVSVVVSYLAVSAFSGLQDLRETFDNLDLVVAHSGAPSPMHVGRVVHVATADVQTERATEDGAFGVGVEGAVRLRRDAEYCQWVETHSDREIKDRDGHVERTERTYYYMKMWTSHRVPSLLFNQPAAHHNPQRDPFPSGVVDAVAARVGAFVAPADIASRVRAQEHVISWRPSQLGGLVASPAAQQHKFFYTASDGWFYSKYEASGAETLLKGAMQYLEGTLLDFQIGDLFSRCTAGDIRVRFHAVIPKDGLSIIAKQATDSGRLATFVSSRGQDMAFVHEGVHSPQEMMATEISDARWRFGLLLFGAAVAWIVTFFVVRNVSRQDKQEQMAAAAAAAGVSSHTATEDTVKTKTI